MYVRKVVEVVSSRQEGSGAGTGMAVEGINMSIVSNDDSVKGMESWSLTADAGPTAELRVDFTDAVAAAVAGKELVVPIASGVGGFGVRDGGVFPQDTNGERVVL